MKNQQCIVTHVVVGTIAAVALIYMFTLAICCVWSISPEDKMLGALKDAGLVAIGAIASILARTRPEEPVGDKPAKVVVTNTLSDPVPTTEGTNG